MFRFINSLQVVALFTGMPWLILWLRVAEFPFARVAAITCCVIYLMLWWLMVAAVFLLSEDWK